MAPKSSTRRNQSAAHALANREHVARTSPDRTAELRARLKALVPEAFPDGTFDGDRLRAALGLAEPPEKERYDFTWPGKYEALRALQRVSVATLRPSVDDSVAFEQTNHVFIEGDNLEVLKLLYRSYHQRVKCIYVDPPYNTGNDFIYPDDFRDALARYLEVTAQRDPEGNLVTSNPETSGRYHSAWLSMMYPRLLLARELLRPDGLIFVSIDDHEMHHLRLLMDEIFGPEAFLACFIWHRRQIPDSRNVSRASTDHEYVLAYRSPEARLAGTERNTALYENPDNDPRGPWYSDNLTGLATKAQRPNLHYTVVNPTTGAKYPPSPTRGWAISKENFEKLIAEDRILWPSKPNGRPRLKRFLLEAKNETTAISSMLQVGFTQEGTKTIQDLFGEKVIQFPKPLSLLEALLSQATSGNDIILDLFAGSATTAHAVLTLNRKDGGSRRYIMVQLPEPSGRADLPTIAEIGKERIRRAANVLKDADEGTMLGEVREPAEDLGFRVFRLAESSFAPWEPPGERDGDQYAKQMALVVDPLAKGWQAVDVVWEVAIREGYALASEVQKLSACGLKKLYRVTDLERDQTFYVVLDEEVTLDIVDALCLGKDDLLVCRDVALTDAVAANLALQCRLKTI